MHLSEIVSNVNAELKPATNIDTLIKRWANRAQKKFISIANHKFSWLRLTELTLTTSNGVKEYTLSPLVDLGKAIYFTDRSHPRKLELITLQEFQEAVPNPSDALGPPEFIYLSGFSPVKNQPSASSQLTLVSTSASDTSVVKIEGLNASGVLVGEEITLTGNVAVLSTNSYTRILNRGVNGFLVGTVTITSNAGGVTVDTIAHRNRQGMYPKVWTYPVPADTRTLYYDAYMRLPELVNNNDMSLIPEQYHDALESYCLYRGFLHKENSGMAAEAKSNFEQTVRQAVMDDKGPERIFNLGDSYPDSGSYSNLPGRFPRE